MYRNRRARVNRAIRLAWVFFALGLASVASSTAVLADTSPSPSPLISPSPTASPTSAGPPASLSLGSSSGPVGTAVNVTGSGFPPATDYAIYIDSPDQGYVATPARLSGGLGPRTNSQGSLSQDIGVPPTPFGAHAICADTGYPGSSTSNAVKACAQFSVEAHLTLSQSVGSSGTQITMTATGFPANETVAFYTDTPRDGSPADGNVAGPYFGTPGEFADAQGTLNQTIMWPSYYSSYKVNPASPGPHVICGDTGYPGSPQPDKVKACAQFLVQGSAAVPSVLLGPSSGGVGTKVLVQGTGFAGSTQVYITIDGKTVVTDACSPYLTGETGNFQLEIVMQLHTSFQNCPPTSISYGTHRICVNAMNQACADFALLAAATPAGAYGSIGGLTGTSKTLAIAAGLAVLLLLAVGGTLLARRAAKPKSLPPVY